MSFWHFQAISQVFDLSCDTSNYLVLTAERESATSVILYLKATSENETLSFANTTISLSFPHCMDQHFLKKPLVSFQKAKSWTAFSLPQSFD